MRDAQPRPLDLPSLAAMSDVFYPRIWLRRAKHVPAGTVSITTYFHADAAQLAEVGTGFLLGQATGQQFFNGFFDQTAQLWSRGRRAARDLEPDRLLQGIASGFARPATARRESSPPRRQRRMTKTVEFYFDFGSPAAYLAATQLPHLCADTGAELVWKPMLLGGVFQATGNHSPAEIAPRART